MSSLIFLSILGVPVMLALAAMWRGYVLAVIWGWFVVPQFGLPAISVPSAIGLSLLVGMLTSHRTGAEAEKEETGSEKVIRTALMLTLSPALALLIGWIVKQFL